MISEVFTDVYNHHYSQFWNILVTSKRHPVHFSYHSLHSINFGMCVFIFIHL